MEAIKMKSSVNNIVQLYILEHENDWSDNHPTLWPAGLDSVPTVG